MAHGYAKALVVDTTDGGPPSLVKKDIPLPALGPRQVLVKVSSVAQNPTDVISFDANAFGSGAVLGCDFSGTVEAVGTSVTRISEGDRVAGLIWGGEIKGLGGYSEYTIADEHICFKVPDRISHSEAATVPLASLTALLALFSKSCLNIDRKGAHETTLLVWGGSSSVGQYAIQIAALYGIKVITTCSPRNFDFVKGLGAAHAFDYGDVKVVEDIKAVAPGLRFVFDTIGNATSSVLASQAIDEQGGTLCTVRPGKVFTENVTKQTKVTDVLVWTVFLKDHRHKTFYWPANEEDHKLGAEFCEELPALISAGKIKPNKVTVIPGGLDGVVKGFQEYRDGKVSATKLVYEL